MKTFVSICSYRDPLLQTTLASLINNQSRRHSVTYSILEQTTYDYSLEALHPELLLRSDVIYKRIDPQYSEGVGWARHINSLNITDEDFFYQIDSHMLFEKDWDRHLIEDYKLASRAKGTDRVIITNGTKAFIIGEKGELFLENYENDVTSRGRYKKFRPDNILEAQCEILDSDNTLAPAIHIFAGNFFTHAAWVKNVGINPKIFLSGEEQLMALTSFIQKYAMFHGRKLYCYHLDDTTDYITKQHQDPVVNDDVLKNRIDRSVKELNKYLDSLDEDILLDFYKYSGVDYINRDVDQRSKAETVAWLGPFYNTAVEEPPVEEVVEPEVVEKKPRKRHPKQRKK
jgi:Glycosyltransferase (GlcNAc)